MELRFAKWEVSLAWTIEKFGQVRTKEARRGRTANKERIRVLPWQTLAPWQRELVKGKGKGKVKVKDSNGGIG